jgi:hypothetical protein
MRTVSIARGRHSGRTGFDQVGMESLRKVLHPLMDSRIIAVAQAV